MFGLPLHQLGDVSWWESQCYYHAMGDLGREGLIICYPREAYVCLGVHDDFLQEVDSDHCLQAGLPIMRRETGGGVVRLDGDQVFYQLVLRRDSPLVPACRRLFWKRFLRPAMIVYRESGVPAAVRDPADLVAAGRKCSGNAAGEIGECVAFVGNLLLDFDFQAMSRVFRVPFAGFRAALVAAMRENMTTMADWRTKPIDRDDLAVALALEFEREFGPLRPTKLDAGLIEAAAAARERLTSLEWLEAPGRKQASRRVKIAEGIHVEEHEGGSGPVAVVVRSEELSAPFVGRPAAKGSVVFAAPGSRRYENEYFTNSLHSFVNVSITGKECTRGCAHCQGRLLEWMTPAPTPERLRLVVDTLVEQGCKGLLISGGADRSGEVPLLPYVGALSYARECGLRVVVQPGLIDRETARGLKDAGVEQVLLDVVADEETIRDVLHMDRAPEDFLRSMLACQSAALKFAPHVVIGLHFGSIRGESRALRFISEAEPAALVLVVLQPLRGTPMAAAQPPSVEQVRSIMALARECRPDTPLALGCAQPRGLAKRRIEQIAIDAGFDAIAYPDVSTIAYAESMGLRWEFSELCCSLAVGSASAQVLS